MTTGLPDLVPAPDPGLVPAPCCELVPAPDPGLVPAPCCELVPAPDPGLFLHLLWVSSWPDPGLVPDLVVS
ncbi:hypothetical protein [Mycoplasmopsis bovis]|uniref:hypothetical protein n=1 Tax=Mycoplasmopsis bovis TaxID=28903 RepID=UPI00249F5637|nr:hypothetical protein [Mycoplasmopsis bovis]